MEPVQAEKSPPVQPDYPDRCFACKWLARVEVKTDRGDRTPFLRATAICCRVTARPVDSIDIEGACGSFEAHNFPYQDRQPKMAAEKIRKAQDAHFVTFRKPSAIERLYRFGSSNHYDPWWKYVGVGNRAVYRQLVEQIKSGTVLGRRWK